MEAPGTGGSTRRGLLSRAVVAVGVGPVAAILRDSGGGETSRSQSATKTAALAAVLDVELLVEFTYERVLGLELLEIAGARVAGGFLAHERAHVGLLRGWLSRLGEIPAPPPVDDRAADQRLASHQVPIQLAGLRTERDALKLLIAVEAVAAGAYERAISVLVDPPLLRSAGEMLASEAQHATVLSELLSPGDVASAVPDACVVGTR